jgi:predicted ribosome quality control (RQC) complex YloA/Tae2 family protein
VEIAARRVNFQEEPAVQLVAHDLTGQKERAATALRQSEELLRLQNAERERRMQEHLIAHALALAPAKNEMEKNGSNGSGASPDPKDLAPLPEDFHRFYPASKLGSNGAKATDNVNLQEEAAKLRKLEAELKDREQSLKEARAALKIREEFIEQSEAMLLKKIEAQQERESEIEQRQENLWHMMARIGLPKEEILEPTALS